MIRTLHMLGFIVWHRPFLLLILLVQLITVLGNAEDNLCGPKHAHEACGIDQCCSMYGYCGTTVDYCGAGCQNGYGACNHALSMSVDSDPAATAQTSMRQVGYYQIGQAYSRSCGRVAPEQINTTDITHLILAFAVFDDSSYKVMPASGTDIPYYTRFTALQNHKLETWISVGGGSFSAETWSAMIASSTNRKAFITSLKAFMKKYRFQGVDIDYEFPDPSSSDPKNLLTLVREMRASFGTTYGISLALPNNKATMKGMLVNDMSSSVSFFNYMAYDMGGWGVNSGSKQKAVAFQSDVRTIQPDLQSLRKSLSDPGKINLGIPYYGRGYTLASSSCLVCGCKATGPSSPGPCTDDREGILSLAEIQGVASNENVTIILNKTAMQKRAIWNNEHGTQWMGYDDDDTTALKLQWAASDDLGGVVFWSVDLNSQ